MTNAEQTVLVHLHGAGLPDSVYEEYDLANLEDELTEAIESAGVGEFDGNLLGEGEAILYMYGPDAEVLYAAIRPVLLAYPLCQGARVEIHPGGPEVVGRIESIPLQA